MEKNFIACPHCAARGKERLIRPATKGTPHVSRSDGKNFHLFLEELTVRPAGGHDPIRREILALFRYDLDAAAQKSESSLATVTPAGETTERVLEQVEKAADRLATILDRGDPLRKLYAWNIE